MNVYTDFLLVLNQQYVWFVALVQQVKQFHQFPHHTQLGQMDKDKL
jgi:hypothetical protein